MHFWSNIVEYGQNGAYTSNKVHCIWHFYEKKDLLFTDGMIRINTRNEKSTRTAIPVQFFELISSCNIGRQSFITSQMYNARTHKWLLQEPCLGIIVGFFDKIVKVKIEVSLCVQSFNSIHEEFFYTQKLEADNSINLCLDVRQMQKNIIITVTGGVK